MILIHYSAKNLCQPMYLKKIFFGLKKGGFSSSKITPKLKTSQIFFFNLIPSTYFNTVNAKYSKVKVFFQWILNGNFSNFEESKQIKVLSQYRYFKRSYSPKNPFCSLEPFFGCPNITPNFAFSQLLIEIRFLHETKST